MQRFEPKDERRDGVARKRDGRGDKRTGGEGRGGARARPGGSRDARPAKERDEAGRGRTRPTSASQAKTAASESKSARARSQETPALAADAGPSVKRLDLARPTGPRPELAAPAILTVKPDETYGLLDTGDGEKLERYGPLTVRRPENQAIWPRRRPSSEWDGADAIFTGDTDEEGTGRWRFPAEPLGETWPLAYDGIAYHGRFTSFRHTGVFPEQAAHWSFLSEAIARAGRPVRLLNLFGYTGLASLVAARAGAEVTHVDASKKAIGWARENQALAEMDDKPIRWICEDAVRYAEREVKRGSGYEAILLDPPKFGRGPKGEVWQLFEDLPYLLGLTRALLSDRPLFVILTAYSIRASFFSLGALMGESFRGLGGQIEAGELLIEEEGEDPRLLSTSLFSRWTA
ncbi:MAG: class I SAM-dependent rRNA methyltransferase [Fulvimarina manganoxydans]|uniref:class I SAM-dependent methyltransferase n=1 Tax=Fulvimarina manganoxydans TaxID=937218 RepID=UPI003B5A1532|nr:class I SAM-dependent rRNA methyltransferase [Fulvimarina manganoxydans]